MSQPVPSGQVTYDGTAESRIRLVNWMAERIDDPAPDGILVIKVADNATGEPKDVELINGMTVVRNPNGTFGIEEQATQIERA